MGARPFYLKYRIAFVLAYIDCEVNGFVAFWVLTLMQGGICSFYHK